MTEMNPGICWDPFVFLLKRLPGRGRADVCFSCRRFRWWSLLVSDSNVFLRPGYDRAASGGRPGSVGKWRQTLGTFLFQHLERTVVTSSQLLQTSARQTEGGDCSYVRWFTHAASFWILAGCWRQTQAASVGLEPSKPHVKPPQLCLCSKAAFYPD